MPMLWCPNCAANRNAETDHSTGSISCPGCAKIIVNDVYSDEPIFVKGPGGEVRTGTVRVGNAFNSQSVKRGTYHIDDLASKVGVSDAFTVVQATNFYQIAHERGFTRGRETRKVAAACLYVGCRANKVPFLLIDFSAEMAMSVYELGVVYLELVKVLSLEMHSFVQKLVDPSLFIHRYTYALLKEKNSKVSMAALRIIASMKRDWMQTGRKPSGLCGAAVYIAAIASGFSCQKSDIVKIVHVCENTLTKRLIEFGNTESASLTIDEFCENAKDFAGECSLKQQDLRESLEVLCQHKGEKLYCLGLCNVCYKEFVEISGGLSGKSDPPAFERAKMERLIKGCENDKLGVLRKFDSDEIDIGDDTDNLSDVDDVEVNGYLNNEKEIKLKKAIWDEMNREYLREQELKKALGKARKKQTHTRASKGKNDGPAPTAAEASCQELNKNKRLASLVNFDVVNKLFTDDKAPDAKKSRIDESNATEQENVKEDDLANEDDQEEEDLVGEDDQEGEYFDNSAASGHQRYPPNGEEGYDYNNNYDGYGYDDYN